MSPPEHVIDLLPAYALNCLDAEEELQVSEHLATCTACSAELQNHHQVVEHLPQAMLQYTPPPALKEKIMARARASKAQPALATSPTRPAPFSRLLRGLIPAWSLVSLVVIVVLGFSNLALWRQVTQLRSATQATLMTVPLQATEFSPAANGLLVISRNGEHGTLVVDGLPVLDEQHEYQLWLIRDGQRTSGGVFSVSKDGYGSMWVGSPAPLAQYQSFGITIEPAGGSPGPTGEKVLGGDL